MQESKQSILVISSWYPSDEQPTYGSFVHEQVKMLQKQGHVVTVLKPSLNGSFQDTIQGRRASTQSYFYDDVEVLVAAVDVWLPKMKGFFLKRLISKCIDILKERNLKFDLIHSHAFFSAGIVASSIASKFSKILFHTEHSSGLIYGSHLFSRIDQFYFDKLQRHAKKFFFVSHFAKDRMIQFSGISDQDKIVLHNCVHSSFFNSSFIQKRNQLIIIGDYIPVKNHDFILEVWKHFLAIAPGHLQHFELVFAGNGFNQENFKKKVADMKQFSVLPRLNRFEVQNIIAQSHILLSASHVETFGLTIAEALALGTPVVVTDSGGCRDIVEAGDGFIVPQGDVAQFAEKIISVLEGAHDEPQLIRARCHQKFSEAVIYSRLIKELNKQ